MPSENDSERSALASRFRQMFPILSPTEIDRIRQFGELRRFRPGEMLSRVGKPSLGMVLILSGRTAVIGRDALGRAPPLAELAQLIGATVADIEVAPGRILDDVGQLSGGLSVADVQAVDDVEAIVVPPERIRVLFVADAELGERILRALMLRRVALIEMGFGGPVLIGPPRSPDVTRLSGFLGRNSIPFRVFDPDEDADASSLLARYAPKPAELPIVIMPDGTVLRNPTDQELARALGLVATNLQRLRASRSSCSKLAPSADRLARARGSKTVSAFPQGFPGRR